MYDYIVVFVVIKQKTAYEMLISDSSSDVCPSDLSLAIDQQQMLAPCAQIERQTHRRDASGAGTETYDARVLDPLALQFQRIEQARAQHDRGAVLVVVKHRNVAALDQRAFALAAGGCGDVFEVDATKGRADSRDSVDELLRAPVIHLQSGSKRGREGRRGVVMVI